MNARRAAGLSLAAAGGLAFSLALLAFVLPALLASGQGLEAPQSAPGAAAGERLLSALRFTLTEASLSALLAVAIGLPAAFLVARRTFPGRRLLLALSGVPLCVPPVIIALAFVLFYGRQGWLNLALMKAFGLSEPPITFLYSLAGVVIAHGFYNFPVVLRTVSQVWERLSEAEEEAATLLGASRFRIFRTITLPRLSAAILSSAILVFLYCFFSFVIVLLFGGIGGTTLEVELYQAARSSFDFHLAGTVALVETAAALAIVILYAKLQAALTRDTAGLSIVRKRRAPRNGVETTLIAMYAVFLLVFFAGPLLSVVARSFTAVGHGSFGRLHPGLGAWTSLFARPSFAKALLVTAGTGAAVALLASLAAVFFALLADSRQNRLGGEPLSFRAIPLAPLAVSSVVLGFGWTLLVPRGGILTLILAQTAMAWPFAWAQVRTALDRIPAPVRDASRLLSSGRIDRSLRVLIPLSWKGILAGAGFAFAISAGDASLPLVLSLGPFENLALMLYRLAGSYRFSEACACAIVLAALSGFVFFLEDTDTTTGRARKQD